MTTDRVTDQIVIDTAEPIDLSPAGVDTILAALAAAGIEVHHHETDGDHYIDVRLTPIDVDEATVLCWHHDGQGWRIIEFGPDGVEWHRWLIGHVGLDAMVVRAGAILAADEVASDYYIRLAARLREVADQVATLAGTRKPRYPTSLTFCVGLLESEAPQVTATVDTIAAALDMEAKTGLMRGSTRIWEHGAHAERDGLKVDVYAHVPAPEDAELAALRARIVELEAQIGEAR